MNLFDAGVYLCLAVAVVTGFNTGLLRSALTILAYLLAMPIAIAVMSMLPSQIGSRLASPLPQNGVLFFGAFLVIGMVLGKLARILLDETVGAEAGMADRVGGAALGALRVGVVATTLVLAFDQLVPAESQPAFLTGSRLRPWFSVAGQKGFRSLPPEVAAAIDRLKRQRQI